MTVRYKRKVKKCRTAFNVNQTGRQGRKLTNANFAADSLNIMKEISMAKYADKRPAHTLIADKLFHGNANMISLRSTLLLGLRGMAACQHHARAEGSFADYRSLCDEVRNKIWR